MPITPHPNDADHYRALLNEVMDLAADIARAIHREATAPGAKPGPETATAFDKIARVIRRCITLARRLDDPIRTQTETRRKIIRAVEDAIHRDSPPGDSDSLHAELYERLDAPEFTDDLHRPAADLIAEICRDLGIAALPGTDPWKRRPPADIAALHARAATLGRAASTIPPTQRAESRAPPKIPLTPHPH